eukprot:TRINITY_DN2359_c0_g1_i2.p1 TRINITY_DN2359_c0_g1~~TRINITY_DN2359_c0_g1_i2.p1  ORF type:complete len:145 (-),score=15.75 TRINITY_DN2359_c0_g1_i2:64-498(-)
MAESHKDGHIFKFPRTKHILDAGGSGVARDDLLMDKTEAQIFFSSTVIVEEKVDGGNLGISLTEDWNLTFHNRGHYVTSASAIQWKNLDNWVKQHPGLFQVLTSPDIVLFGEWCYQKHSIHYTKLPDYFLAFDIYDKSVQKYYF